MIVKEQAIQEFLLLLFFSMLPILVPHSLCPLWHLEMNAISYGDNKANSVPFCRTLGCMSSYT